MSSVSLRNVLAVALVLACVEGRGLAMTGPPVTLADITMMAGRIFRGRCVSAEVGTVEVGGARIATTTYTFEVLDFIKGGGGRTLSFRQVGTPGGGKADLGRAVGLPVYAPGVEYVIFLLPESRARLTSPAGTNRGAFVMRGEDVAVPPGLAGLAPSDARGPLLPYHAVRHAIVKAFGGAPPGRP